MTGTILKNQLQKYGISLSEIARRLGMSQQSFNQALNAADIKSGLIEKISEALNVPMTYFYPSDKIAVSTSAEGIPYYKNVPVSAGQADLMVVDCNEDAVGYINITGVTGKCAFPVVGCSMEPVIHAGDIVVVDTVDNWSRLDPDKIYLIFTHDDRMIKHLEIDESNDSILWCVSPNYKRFSIDKSDILRIYRVTFYGRLA